MALDSKTAVPVRNETRTFGRHTLIHGDAVEVLKTFADNSFDCFLTDPPYCAATRGSTCKAPTTKKYTSTGAQQFAPFVGDSRDQRSFLIWSSIWMTEAFRCTRSGGALSCFIDYRNLHCVVDAIQVAGWDFDGIIPWIKRNGRPRLGWFQTSRTEYVILGRKGKTPEGQRKCGPPWLESGLPKNRIHPTQKPVEIFVELLRFRDDWQRICDPFAGSGTAILAAEQLGRECVAVEKSDEYFQLASEYLQDRAPNH